MKNLAIVLLAALTTLTLACGYGSKATTPSTPGTTPTISELAPDSTHHGGPAFVLTANGSRFSTTAVINFNGTAQTTTYVSANQLMATIPASAIATAGTVAVTVTNPSTSGMGAYGSGGTLAATSTPMNFTVN
jgi:type IV pilus biogenesis protein CpaD/CtpE